MQGLDISILGPACVAGLIVLSTHVPLGKQVLGRGIIFIDLAIAQIAGLGVILAQYFGIEEHGLGVQFAAAAAALTGAGLLAWTDRRWPKVPGAADRHPVRAGSDRRTVAAGRQSAGWRTSEGPAGRADPVGELFAIDPGGNPVWRAAGGDVAAPRTADRIAVLRAVRTGDHRCRCSWSVSIWSSPA